MSVIFITVISVLLVIVTGYALSRFLLTDDAFWQGVSRLCYWVLFPVMLVKVLSGADFSGSWVGSLALVLWAALLLMLGYSLLTGRLLKLTGPSTSSMVQGNLRHNTFIGIAIMGDVLGLRGVELAALATAILVPAVNVLCVMSMLRLNGNGDGDEEKSIKRLIIKELVRNPLIIAVVIGLAINALDWSLPVLAMQTMDLLSRAALPMLLMAVGASMKLRAISSNWQALLSVLLGKGMVMPAFTLVTTMALGLPNEVVLTAVVFTALPTAASAYALAQQLKGDVPLMADIISVQTLFSLLTLTIWSMVVIELTGLSIGT
ncbi:MAG TPA: AEC family transporter [Oceanospirillaceae bacterium]|nr:AEC family transporter [Oceanospirillaceae bacterium]